MFLEINKMKKIVINKCYGGFGLSQEAFIELQKLDSEDTAFYHRNNRDSLKLIEVIEKLGSRANGQHSELKIVEIPDDVDYIIEEYDGLEWVSEVHRTWS
jgi:hypothetical protein